MYISSCMFVDFLHCLRHKLQPPVSMTWISLNATDVLSHFVSGGLYALLGECSSTFISLKVQFLCVDFFVSSLRC